MNYMGKPIPIIYSFQCGKVVWDYALPQELEKTKYGLRQKVNIKNKPATQKVTTGTALRL